MIDCCIFLSQGTLFAITTSRRVNHWGIMRLIITIVYVKPWKTWTGIGVENPCDFDTNYSYDFKPEMLTVSHLYPLEDTHTCQLLVVFRGGFFTIRSVPYFEPIAQFSRINGFSLEYIYVL